MSSARFDVAAQLARATEAAALAAARLAGTGDRTAIDRAAVDAMRAALAALDLDGVVVASEGEKDAAPMLDPGERAGTGRGPALDLAIDPVDGTAAVAAGAGGAIAAIGAAPRGCLRAPVLAYMERIAVPAAAAGRIELGAPVADTLATVARALGKRVAELQVCVLDRARNAPVIDAVLRAGARLVRPRYADLGAAIAAVVPGRGPDVLLGIGGAPETVIAACAARACGGDLQCRPWPRDDAERRRAAVLGIELSRVLALSDVVRGDRAWCAASGVTDGELLAGADPNAEPPRAHSLVLPAGSTQ